jgi:hypothetical protein
MAAQKGPASPRPRCTRSGSSVAAIPVYPVVQVSVSSEPIKTFLYWVQNSVKRASLCSLACCYKQDKTFTICFFPSWPVIPRILGPVHLELSRFYCIRHRSLICLTSLPETTTVQFPNNPNVFLAPVIGVKRYRQVLTSTQKNRRVTLP